MKILIDIGHPAHVHLFRFFAEEMKSRGHAVLFTVREKEHETYLLKTFGLPYVSIGRHYGSLAGKSIGMTVSLFRMMKEALRFRPDIFLSHGSIIAAFTSLLTRRPHISLEDTGNREQVRLYLPFTEAVLTSEAFHRDYGKKQVRYNGFHELAYLHPSYFYPDKKFRSRLDARLNGKMIMVRFVSWNATHDKSSKGLSDDEKRKLVKALSMKGRVFISAEGGLPDYLNEYRYPLAPETIHQALANADLFIGEGATMASECAMLGTPAIYINPQIAGTINEQVRNGLIFQYPGFSGVTEKADEILGMDNAEEVFRIQKEKMLAGKTDLTRLLIWFVENWPHSLETLRLKPDFQKDFL